MKDTVAPSAIDVLADLAGTGLDPKRIDETHDTLKLLGFVVAQVTLLKLATDARADSRARVSAARALLAGKESPESIAERLRRSPFAGLTVDALERIIDGVKTNAADLATLIERERQILTTSQG